MNISKNKTKTKKQNKKIKKQIRNSSLLARAHAHILGHARRLVQVTGSGSAVIDAMAVPFNSHAPYLALSCSDQMVKLGPRVLGS